MYPNKYRGKYKRRFRKRVKKYYKKKGFSPSKPFGVVHRFTRTCQLSSLVFPTAVNSYGAYSFNLDALPNPSEFKNLFDEYMIRKIKIQFLPIGATTQITDVITASIPHMIIVVDKDDASAPTSVNELLQYPSCRIVKANKRHVHVFRPRWSTQIYESGVSTAYGSRTGYIDCGNPTVPHFGIKYCLYNSNTANLCAYQVFVTYYLLLRGVR